MTHIDKTAESALSRLRNGSDAPGHTPCGSHRRWAVCQTHPQAERWASANLNRQGYTAYLPLRTVTRRDPATPTLTRLVEVPLFSSYLFVVPGTHWSPICHTLGVLRLLMAGPNPHIVPDGLVEAVEAGQELRAAPTPENAKWAPGTPCSLATGAFTGHEAVVLSATRSNARVGLVLFGHLREVSVPLNCLKAR